MGPIDIIRIKLEKLEPEHPLGDIPNYESVNYEAFLSALQKWKPQKEEDKKFNVELSLSGYESKSKKYEIRWKEGEHTNNVEMYRYEGSTLLKKYDSYETNWSNKYPCLFFQDNYVLEMWIHAIAESARFDIAKYNTDQWKNVFQGNQLNKWEFGGEKYDFLDINIIGTQGRDKAYYNSYGNIKDKLHYENQVVSSKEQLAVCFLPMIRNWTQSKKDHTGSWLENNYAKDPKLSWVSSEIDRVGIVKVRWNNRKGEMNTPSGNVNVQVLHFHIKVVVNEEEEEGSATEFCL